MRSIAYPLVVAFASSLAVAAYAAPTPTDTLVDIETRWSAALASHDTAFVDHVLAADWAGESGDGAHADKAQMLNMLKSGKLSITKMTNHDVTARVFGDIGVVQGMDDETSTYDGKDTSGTYIWTDVFQKRNGRWVAVASQTGPVKK